METVGLGLYFIIAVLAAYLNFLAMLSWGRYEFAIPMLMLAISAVIAELIVTGKTQLRWEWDHLMDLPMASRIKIGARSFTLLAISFLVIGLFLFYGL